jgi:hypothetical protein
MSSVSRRSFAESLAIAALAPPLPIKGAPVYATLLALGMQHQSRMNFHRLRPLGL